MQQASHLRKIFVRQGEFSDIGLIENRRDSGRANQAGKRQCKDGLTCFTKQASQTVKNCHRRSGHIGQKLSYGHSEAKNGQEKQSDGRGLDEFSNLQTGNY